MNFMFSAKELDRETGFYYYGARYLDPKYSRWISADPAMNTGEYFPQAPINDEAKKHNGNLPGMGGIFNHINGNLFAYAANNPIKYTDPDGRMPFLVVTAFAGAAIGAIYGACKSYQETGSVDWKEVGKDALIGGAIGLCGGAAVSLGTTFLSSGAAGATILADSYTISAAVDIIGHKLITGLCATVVTLLNRCQGNPNSANTVSKFSAEGLKMTQTVANHLNDIIKHGANKGQLSRPYINSTLLLNEIMNAQDPVKDAAVEGALKWAVEGTFNGASGTWELVVDFTTNTILHFNFVTD